MVEWAPSRYFCTPSFWITKKALVAASLEAAGAFTPMA